jgi:FAD/FMN-containing dehydrogenase
MLSEATIASLKSNMRGELIEPSDARYNEARKVYNGMIDRRPRIIARCVDVADVIAAVNFGREHNLLIAIRGGGHNACGLGVCDDGLVIDLSYMNYVRVDPKRRSVLVGGGALLGAVDHATYAFGLAMNDEHEWPPPGRTIIGAVAGGPRLVIEHVRSWERESFARREPRRARERLGPLNPTTRQPKP